MRLSFAKPSRQTLLKSKVITGFNTDIEYNGVTYHVQTEDKGLDTPLILSLVYNRGTILASKRSPYNDLLLGTFNEKELSERLQRQHKLICAAIRAGRIEDLKQMNSKDTKPTTAKNVEKERESLLTQKPAAGPKVKKVEKIEQKIELQPLAQITRKIEQSPAPTSFVHSIPIQKPEIELPTTKTFENLPLEVGKETEVPEFPIEITDADLIIHDTNKLEEIVLPAEAVEIVTDFSKNNEAKNDSLFIELLNDVTFRSGESQTISVMVGRGSGRIGLVGANIMIKVLGTNFRPLIFHTKTDSNGVAILTLQIPQFSRGRAAILLKAMNNGEEAEMRRVIFPG